MNATQDDETQDGEAVLTPEVLPVRPVYHPAVLPEAISFTHGETTTLKAFYRLNRAVMTLDELVRATGLTTKTVRVHLTRLRTAGIVHRLQKSVYQITGLGVRIGESRSLNKETNPHV